MTPSTITPAARSLPVWVGRLGTHAIVIRHQVQELGDDQALPLGGAREGQHALQTRQTLDAGEVGCAHGPSLPHKSDRIRPTPGSYAQPRPTTSRSRSGSNGWW